MCKPGERRARSGDSELASRLFFGRNLTMTIIKSLFAAALLSTAAVASFAQAPAAPKAPASATPTATTVKPVAATTAAPVASTVKKHHKHHAAGKASTSAKVTPASK